MMRLGIIAGANSLPLIVARHVVQDGGEVFIVCIDSFANADDYAHYSHKRIKIGMVGEAMDFFKKNCIDNIVFLGNVTMPSLRDIAVDTLGTKLVARIISNKFLGDNAVLNVVSDFFSDHGFKMLDVRTVVKDILIFKESGVITLLKPTSSDIESIKLGQEILDAIDSFDIGQSIVISNTRTIAIEAAEGTNAMIERSGQFLNKNSYGILVKQLKKIQSGITDLPTIGPHTIDLCAKNNIKGIAIQKNHVIVIDKEDVINLANDMGIFIFLI